jgi:hypothetical protein
VRHHHNYLFIAKRKQKAESKNVIGVNITFSNSLFENRLPIVFMKKSANMHQNAILKTIGLNFTSIKPACMATIVSMTRLSAMEVISKEIIWSSLFNLPPHIISRGTKPMSTSKWKMTTDEKIKSNAIVANRLEIKFNITDGYTIIVALEIY